MMSARNAAIVVLPSSSLMVALISQMHSTASRHGPAAIDRGVRERRHAVGDRVAAIEAFEGEADAGHGVNERVSR